jgi:hypothetical protein
VLAADRLGWVAAVEIRATGRCRAGGQSAGGSATTGPGEPMGDVASPASLRVSSCRRHRSPACISNRRSLRAWRRMRRRSLAGGCRDTFKHLRGHDQGARGQSDRRGQGLQGLCPKRRADRGRPAQPHQLHRVTMSANAGIQELTVAVGPGERCPRKAYITSILPSPTLSGRSRSISTCSGRLGVFCWKRPDTKP